MTRTVNSASTLVRGGQTTQHWWRMGLQVFKFSTVVAAFIYTAFFSYIVFSSYSIDEMRVAIFYEMAERGVVDQSGFNKTYTFRDMDGTSVTMDAVDLYRSSTHRSVRDGFFQTIFNASRFSILPALIAGFGSLLVFVRTGNRIQENEFIRGSRVVSAGQLKRWCEAKWKSYHNQFKGRKTTKPLTVGGIPFPPNAVEAQTCIYGTVGVGKTNAMLEMLYTIRANGGRAVIYDRMGTFVSRFYDEETDIIVNPFDSRSHSWNIFDDVIDAASFTQMANVMIPEHRGAASDPFWSQSARIVFDYAARELYKTGPRTMKALIDYVIQMDADKLSELIKGTPGKHFFNDNIEKTSQSIRANLIAELRFLEFLRDDAPSLSVRKWVRDDKPSFLFLTGDAEHAAATRNIISAILEVAANSLMSLPPATEPRCYFFMDELPSLNRLPFLISSLAEIRQFGGAFMLGYQVYSQLEDIYGREAAESISGTTNNRIVFNTPDFRTAKRCSESLGNQDIWEANSNISVGAHEARDGVGFTQQRTERPVVSASEIQNLPQFKAWVRFAYDAPTALLSMKPVDFEPKVPLFQPYMGDAPGFDRYAPPDQETPKDALDDTKIRSAFREWCSWKFDVTNLNWPEGKGAFPSKVQPFYRHFSAQLRAGADPDSIQPIVDMTEGLMQNRPCPTASPSPDCASDHDLRHVTDEPHINHPPHTSTATKQGLQNQNQPETSVAQRAAAVSSEHSAPASQKEFQLASERPKTPSAISQSPERSPTSDPLLPSLSEQWK